MPKRFGHITALVLTMFACAGCTISALGIGDYSKSVEGYTKAFKQSDSVYLAFRTREWKPEWFKSKATDRWGEGWAELSLGANGTITPRYRQIHDEALPPEVEENGTSVPIRFDIDDVMPEEGKTYGSISRPSGRAERVAAHAAKSEIPQAKLAVYPIGHGYFYLVNYDSSGLPQSPVLIEGPFLPMGKHWWGYPAMYAALPPAVTFDLFVVALIIMSADESSRKSSVGEGLRDKH